MRGAGNVAGSWCGNEASSVGARYAAPDGAGRLNGSGILQRCRAYGAGHLVLHFVLRWQAERDTAFVRTRGFPTFGAAPRARKRRRRCALPAQYKPEAARMGEAFFRPCGTCGVGAADDPAMNGWAIFTNTSRSFARSAERRRAEARRAGIFVDCGREDYTSSVGAKYAVPNGAGK